jgi:hypothetical protein
MGVGNVHGTAQVAAGNCLAVACTCVWGGHFWGVGVFTVKTAWSSHFQKRLKSSFQELSPLSEESHGSLVTKNTHWSKIYAFELVKRVYT